jgi:hypothetical protein
MCVVANISHDKFPKQGNWLNRPVSVCFNYDTSKRMTGTIVREDAEAPGVMIIALDNGRFVLSTECQYQTLSLAFTRGSA